MRKRTISLLSDKRLSKYRSALFPLCFVFYYTLKLVFFYLGFGFEENIIDT